MAKFTALENKAISAMNGAQLLVLFNEAAVLVGAPICKRFASLTNGFNRTMKMVEQAREWEAAHPEIQADPAMNSKTVTPAAIAKKVKDSPKKAIAKESAKKGAKVWEIPKDGSCPKCGGEHDITPAGLEGTAAEHRRLHHGCGFEWDPETGKEYNKPKNTPGLRSAAVSKSWEDAEVRSKRAERSSVQVSGGDLKKPLEFKSVAKAFLDLRLPMGKHIQFRGALKAAKTLKFDDYTFKIVATVTPEPKKAKKAKK